MNLRNSLGFALIAAGIVAMPIPILPGVPLVVAGAALLGRRHPVVRHAMAWIEKRGFLERRSRS